MLDVMHVVYGVYKLVRCARVTDTATYCQYTKAEVYILWMFIYLLFIFCLIIYFDKLTSFSIHSIELTTKNVQICMTYCFRFLDIFATANLWAIQEFTVMLLECVMCAPL